MKRSLTAVAGGLAVASVLVVGFDYATYATTGQSMIIGQLNTGDNVTRVRRTTAGPAMEFQTTAGSAPFSVQRNSRVVKLNADYVDGRHATALENAVYTYTLATAGGAAETYYTIPQVPAGNYLLTYTATFYPQGTPANPVTFSCFSINAPYTAVTSQASNSSAYSNGYYVGVNGSTPETVPASGMPTVGCGAKDSTAANVAWTWGNKPLQVTLVKVNGLSSGSLGTAAAPAKGPGRTHTTTP